MKIEWRFNGSQQLLIIPENKKDEQLIQLFVGGHECIKFCQPPASSPNTLVLESFEVQQVFSEDRGLRRVDEIAKETGVKDFISG